MTVTFGLLVFAFAYILMGVGVFLEGIRRPRSLFAQQGWHIRARGSGFADFY